MLYPSPDHATGLRLLQRYWLYRKLAEILLDLPFYIGAKYLRKCNSSEVETLQIVRVWWEADARSVLKIEGSRSRSLQGHVRKI